MAVRGNLQDLELLTLLQMTCEEGGDAQITLQHGLENVSLYIQGGQIVHAESQTDSGEAIIYEVLGWKHGTFSLNRMVPAPAISIHKDWNSLLLEGLRRLDEQGGQYQAAPAPVLLAVSDNPATLTRLQAILAPYETELHLLTVDNHADALARLTHLPDLLLLAWENAPLQNDLLFTHLVSQKVPIPTIFLVQSDDPKLPDISLYNPSLFLRLPPDPAALMAAVWGQVSRGATGEASGLTLFTLCEWMRLSRFSALIRVATPQHEGLLAIVDGVLLNAVSSQKLGEEAVETIFGWTQITVEFAPITAKVKALIQRPLKAILSESEAYRMNVAAQTAPLTLRDDKGTSPLYQKEIKDNSLPTQATNGTGALASESPATARSHPSVASPPFTHSQDAAALSLPTDTTEPPSDPLASSPIHGDSSQTISTALQGVDIMAGQTTENRIEKTLADIMTINGAIGVALVDITSGMALGKAGSTTLDLDAAAAGNSEVVKAKLRVMKDLDIRGQIEDILITLQTQYHLIRPLGSDNSLFLYVVLNKETANLALARRQLSKSESSLVV